MEPVLFVISHMVFNQLLDIFSRDQFAHVKLFIVFFSANKRSISVLHSSCMIGEIRSCYSILVVSVLGVICFENVIILEQKWRYSWFWFWFLFPSPQSMDQFLHVVRTSSLTHGNNATNLSAMWFPPAHHWSTKMGIRNTDDLASFPKL